MAINKALATVAVLFLIFLLALTIRIEPMKYGELNEFDPFWNYKATKYLVDNGWEKYKQWHDYDSWYPLGRDASFTSQEGLHLTTAFLYNFYNGNLYDFTILIPAIFGALTVFPLYLLVSQMSSRRAGLVACFFYSITYVILQRNSAGWFKSEPLGLLLGLIGLSIFVYIIYRSKIDKKMILLGFVSGMILTYSISTWVGSMILILPILFYGLVAPIWINGRFGLPLISIGVGSLMPMLVFERTALLLPVSLILVGLGVYAVYSHKIKKNYKIIFAVMVVVIGIIGITNPEVTDKLRISDRFKLDLIPFLENDNSIVNSIAEHRTPTFEDTVYLQGFYLFLAPIGLILFLSEKDLKNKIWLVVLAGTLFYFGISILRLHLMVSLAMIILSSIGVVMIMDDLKRTRKKLNIVLFTTVLLVSIIPFSILWVDMADSPPSILNGATRNAKLTNEWLMAMDFIKAQDGKTVFAWWDYGYWISVLGEKATFMDNSTIYSHLIKKYAEIFTMNPTDAHAELKKLQADYVLVYSTTVKYNGTYSIIGGGDEYKSGWMFEIAGKNNTVIDNVFYKDTLIGSLIPFSIKDGQYIRDYNKNPELFELIYLSPSYLKDEDGIRYGILIYKVL